MTIQPIDHARFGPYEADLHTHELWKFGTRIRLVGQPFEVLAVLLRRAGELVTRDELRNQLWPSDTFVDFNQGLNVAANKLREALATPPMRPRYIETVPRRGYRFIAAVEWAQPQPSPAVIQPVGAENNCNFGRVHRLPTSGVCSVSIDRAKLHPSPMGSATPPPDLGSKT